MKIWTDERGNKWSEPDCCDEWLFDIWAIGCDYDGETTVEGLKRLVDQLVFMSQKARDCLHDGKLFPENKIPSLIGVMLRAKFAESVGRKHPATAADRPRESR